MFCACFPPQLWHKANEIGIRLTHLQWTCISDGEIRWIICRSWSPTLNIMNMKKNWLDYLFAQRRWWHSEIILEPYPPNSQLIILARHECKTPRYPKKHKRERNKIMKSNLDHVARDEYQIEEVPKCLVRELRRLILDHLRIRLGRARRSHAYSRSVLKDRPDTSGVIYRAKMRDPKTISFHWASSNCVNGGSVLALLRRPSPEVPLSKASNFLSSS